MADINVNFAIRQFLPQPQGTPIVAPIGCSQVVLENTDPLNAIQVYTDPSTAATILATTKNLPAGLELTLRASVLCWGPGTAICYITGGVSMPVAVTFLR